MNCPYSVNSPQSEPPSPCRLHLMPGFSLFLFPWAVVGGTSTKKVSPAMRETKYLPSLNSSRPVCPRNGTDCCVVAQGEVNMWTSRKTSGLTGNCLRVQMNPLAGKYWKEASRSAWIVQDVGVFRQSLRGQ